MASHLDRSCLSGTRGRCAQHLNVRRATSARAKGAGGAAKTARRWSPRVRRRSAADTTKAGVARGARARARQVLRGADATAEHAVQLQSSGSMLDAALVSGSSTP